MKLRISILSILAALPLLSSAQSVPGYLGKRLVLSYNAYIFPSLANPNSSEVEMVDHSIDQGFSINYQHHLVTEYVLSKKYSLTGDITYSRTYFDPKAGHSYYYYGTEAEAQLEELPGVSALGFIAGFRNYKKHFAPLGNYFEYRLGYVNLNVDDVEYSLITAGDVTVDGGTTGSFIAGMAWGTNRIIKDRYMLSFSFEISYFGKGWSHAANLMGAGDYSLDFQEQNSQSNQDLLLDMAAGRYAMQSFINFRIGVGFLP